MFVISFKVSNFVWQAAPIELFEQKSHERLKFFNCHALFELKIPIGYQIFEVWGK
jgi:hypothetical protein